MNLEDPDAGQHRNHRGDSDDLVNQVLFAPRPARNGNGGGVHACCLSTSRDERFDHRKGPEHVLTIKIQFTCVVNQPKVLLLWLRTSRGKTRDLVVAARSSFGNMLDGTGAGTYLASALVGSMIALTSAMELAGNPPWVACSRMICSFDAL